MKIIEGYMLKEIAGNYVVIPVGQKIIDSKRMLSLNNTGAFIWELLETNLSYDEILNKLVLKYEANKEEIPILKTDLDDFINTMRSMNLLCFD